MSEDEVFAKSEKICTTITSLPQFINAKTVMLYLDFKNEVKTDLLICAALEKQKNVLVPEVRGDDIVARLISSCTDFKKGAFGIAVPCSGAVWNGDIDLCVVPALGFDRRGGRIGFGKGYYDRFFEKKRCIKLGAAYSSQLEEDVFSEPHDVAMDIIVTERECIFCE